MIQARPRLRPPETGQVAVDTTPGLVLGENSLRDSAIICNSGTVTVFVGFTPNVSVDTGFGLPPGSGFGFTSTRALYAVVASTGSTLSFIEESG